MNPTSDDLETVWRARTYAMLGRLLLKPPDDKTLNSLEHIEIHDQDSEEPPLASAWRALADAARNVDSLTLRDEYADLLIGVTRGEVVAYASWYLTGFLMEKPLGVLRSDLSKLGFQRQSGIAEPEDHAGALLEVMAVLVEEDRDEQRGFFEKHIGTWMARFFGDVRNADSAGFYKHVGGLGEAFLRNETEYFQLADLAAGMGRSRVV